MGEYLKNFSEYVNESKSDSHLNSKFTEFAKALENKKVPCELVLKEFGEKEKFVVKCGWNYPEKLANLSWDAAESVGLSSSQFSIAADSHGGKTIKSKIIHGGPKRY